MTKEINLSDIDLDVLEAALRIIQTKEGKTEHLGEARVHQTTVCLLCDATEEKEYYAEEVLCINSVGDVRWIKLIDEDQRPIYNDTYRYTTHRTHCPRCAPRLLRLNKRELVILAIGLSKATMWSLRRAGRAHLGSREEVSIDGRL